MTAQTTPTNASLGAAEAPAPQVPNSQKHAAVEAAAEKVITISEFGAEKAQGILANSGKDGAGVRVFIKSGGCSGYQYGMAIDDRELEGDNIVYDRGVKLLVDQASLALLRGSEVDFVENLMGGGFTVNNPNATSLCGCGHSFRTDGASAPATEGSAGCGGGSAF